MSVEAKIAPANVMLSEEYLEWGMLGPPSVAEPARCCIFNGPGKDVDEFFMRAVKAGASVIRPSTDQFYGERTNGYSPRRLSRLSLHSAVRKLSVSSKCNASPETSRPNWHIIRKTNFARMRAIAGVAQW